MKLKATNPKDIGVLRMSTIQCKLPNKYTLYLNEHYCGLLLNNKELIRIEKRGGVKVFDKFHEKYLTVLRNVAKYAKWEGFYEPNR